MFYLGLLAIFQTIFLPGVLMLRLLPRRGRVIPQLAYTFGLSLLVNYVLVLALTTVHLYTRAALLVIIAAEVIAVIVLYRQAIFQPLGQVSGNMLEALKEQIGRWYSQFQTWVERGAETNPLSRIVRLLIAAVIVGYALSVVVWGFRVWFNGFGMVIDHWDAIASWNRWASEWAGNALPGKTWEYPQLLPANLSISYVLLGSAQLQLFNTAWLGLFTTFILLLAFDLALQHPGIGAFAGIIAVKFILKKFTGIYMNTAYADIPLAFFAFAAVFAILERGTVQREQHAKSTLSIGFLLSAGAALTKQGGLALFVFLPLFLWFGSGMRVGDFQASKRFEWLPLITALIITLPWYLYVQIGISSGQIESNIAWVSDGIHGDLTYLERFMAAFRSLGVYGGVLVIAVVGGVWLDKTTRWLVYGLVLPYFLAWAFFFGYSPRNLSLVFPFWGLAAGLVLGKLVGWGTVLIERIRLARWPAIALSALLLIGVVVGGLILTDGRLIARQEEQQRMILDRQINQLLYDYFEELGRVEPVLSNFPIDSLPGLQLEFFGFRSEYKFDTLWTDNPAINLMLMPNDAYEPLKAEILSRVDQGEYELLFHENRYYFIHRITP